MKFIIVLLLSAVVLTACSSDDEKGTNEPVTVAPKSLSFNDGGGTEILTVTGEWNGIPVGYSQEWLTVTVSDDKTKVTVVAANNTSTQQRASTISIADILVPVTQKPFGESAKLTLSKDGLNFSRDVLLSETQSVIVYPKNLSVWTAESSDSWIKIAQKDNNITVSVEVNEKDSPRVGKVVFSAPELENDVELPIGQAGMKASFNGTYTSTVNGLRYNDPNFLRTFSGKLFTVEDSYDVYETDGEYMWSVHAFTNFTGIIGDVESYLIYNGDIGWVVPSVLSDATGEDENGDQQPLFLMYTTMKDQGVVDAIIKGYNYALDYMDLGLENAGQDGYLVLAFYAGEDGNGNANYTVYTEGYAGLKLHYTASTKGDVSMNAPMYATYDKKIDFRGRTLTAVKSSLSVTSVITQH